LINRGCTGVALFGTTGEGPSMSSHERENLLRQITSQGLETNKVIVSNGAGSIADTVSLGKLALSLGYETYLVAPPTFFKNVSDEGTVAYYRAVINGIASEKIKIILYHIPQFTGVPITNFVVKTLLQEFSSIVVGLKESEGNLPFTKSLLEQYPHFKIFVGHEKQIIQAVRLGGAGSICGAANLYPELISSFCKLAEDTARETPEQIIQLVNVMGNLNFVSAYKAVMEKRRGEIWSTVRPPLTPLNKEEKSQFISKLQASNVEI